MDIRQNMCYFPQNRPLEIILIRFLVKAQSDIPNFNFRDSSLRRKPQESTTVEMSCRNNQHYKVCRLQKWKVDELYKVCSPYIAFFSHPTPYAMFRTLRLFGLILEQRDERIRCQLWIKALKLSGW